ncbi:ankyrin repeat domain-containing protein [Acidobacteriota bacterium]
MKFKTSKNTAKIISIILFLFVTACQDNEKNVSITDGIGDQINRKHVVSEFASTYLGGNGNEFCEAIAIDDEGNIYVTGNTRSSDFPTTEEVYNRNRKGESDVFIAKFDNGLKTLLASTLIGGESGENAYTILFDQRGYIYVAGYTTSKDFPTTTESFDTEYNGGNGDAFILKMDKDLKTLLASTYLGGSGDETDWRSPELLQDNEDNIYIAANTASDDFPTTPGAFCETYNGGQRDVFLSKLDPDLKQLLASTFLGGSADESLGRSFVIDTRNNELCVGGYTFSTNFPTSENAYGREVSEELDGFISKFSMDLTELTASTILDAGWIYCMMIHDNGDIYVGGHAVNRLPTTSNAFYQTFDKALDQGFITCLSNDLTNVKASTVIPGRYATGGGRICSLNLLQSEDGHVLSAGWVRPIDFPITSGVYDETQNGNSDTYIMKMDKDLSKVLLSTFIGGRRSERWNRLAADKAGNIYLASYTLSPDFPTSKEAVFRETSIVISDEEENLSTSPTDAFIIKIDEFLSASVYEEFHEAAKTDQLKTLKKFLSKNKNWLERRDRYERTPLHSAVRYGAFSTAEFLLDKGADIYVKDEHGNTPLHLSSIFGYDDLIDLLIRQGADVDALNNLEQTPLYIASMYGNPESVARLLAGGANMNFMDAERNTPLHIGVLYRRSENVAQMLEFNPDIGAKNKEGFTPLLLAVQSMDNGGIVESLIEKGADLNITDPQGRNALLVSVGSFQRGYFSLLVSNGIDINSQDNMGNTALHYVFGYVLENKQNVPRVKLFTKDLLEEGADPHIKNNEGKSPMDLAVESEEKELIDLLVFPEEK